MLAYVGARPRDWDWAGRFVVDVQYRAHRKPCDLAYKPDTRPYHPKDEDNARAALKAAMDALRDAGVIQTDAKDRFTWGRFELLTTEPDVKRTGKPRGVTVTVRRANVD